MVHQKLFLILAIFLGLVSTSQADPDLFELTPTFNCIGVKWNVDAYHNMTAHVWYKEAGLPDAYYIQAHDLWFDGRTQSPRAYPARRTEYRGSVVNLEPNTSYTIKAKLWDGVNYILEAVDTVSTWSDGYPTNLTVTEQVVHLPAFSTQPFEISGEAMSGSETEYKVYTFDPAIGVACIEINVNDYQEDTQGNYVYPGVTPPCVNIGTGVHHVILRGLTLRGGRNGVFIEPQAHHIVIEECDITGWGREAVLTDADGNPIDEGIGDENGAIESWWMGYGDPTQITDNPHHIVIQRNRIANPRYRSSYWHELPFWKNWLSNNLYETDSGHTFGPLGVLLVNTLGNVVVRYNDVVSQEGHEFSDGIGGHSNFSYMGPFCSDSDIYGNKVTFCWDDGIEAEGGNCNVRIWNNWIDECKVMIAAAATSVGPLYIWNNVVNKGRDKYENGVLIRYGRFLKLEQKDYIGDGRIYVYHNTLLQTDLEGCCAGITRSNIHPVYNLVTRNNLLYVNSATGCPSIRVLNGNPVPPDRGNDLDYDLCNNLVLVPKGQEMNRIVGTPSFTGVVAPGENPLNPGYGSFKLNPHTNGWQAAVYLRNFNSPGYDMGADQNAWYGPMEFGVYAGKGYHPEEFSFKKTLAFQEGAPDPRQPGVTYAGHQDTYVSEYEYGLSTKVSHGSSTIHFLQHNYTHPLGFQSLHKFDVAGCLPWWSKMTGAEFVVVSQSSLPNNTHISCFELKQHWNESFANWGFRDKRLRWGGPIFTNVEEETDFFSSPGACILNEGSPVGSWPLVFSFNHNLDIVQRWIDSPLTNRGFVMIEQLGNQYLIHSNNSSLESLRPKLAITYTLKPPVWAPEL